MAGWGNKLGGGFNAFAKASLHLESEEAELRIYLMLIIS